MIQWLRIHLPIQGTQVQSPVQEDSTCCRAARLVHHNSREDTAARSQSAALKSSPPPPAMGEKPEHSNQEKKKPHKTTDACGEGGVTHPSFQERGHWTLMTKEIWF